MKGNIIKDTLQTAEQIASDITLQQQTDGPDWWLWIAMAEFIVIILLLILLHGRKQNRATPEDERRIFREKSLNEKVDFDNIINSSFNASGLYEKLKVKCHPDRFPTDEIKNKIAENLFQEIEKNKNNLNCLLKLKQEASDKLGINI